MPQPKQITIIQPNRVTYARYDFSATQQNILYNIIHRIQKEIDYASRMNHTLFNEMVVEIPLQELDPSRNYKHIFAEAEKLREKHMRFTYKDEKGRPTYVSTSCLSTIEHTRGTHVVRIYIPAKAATALAYIGEGFTRYQLAIALSLRSKHSKRLYELCCRWQDKEQFSLKITELRELLAVQHTYKRMGELKKHILDVVQADLQHRADIYFSYTLEKGGGRAYETVRFTVLRKAKPQPEPTTQPPPKPAAEPKVVSKASPKTNPKGGVKLIRYKAERLSKEAWLRAFFSKWVPSPPVPTYLCQVLKSNHQLDKAYARFLVLDEAWRTNQKTDHDLQHLVPLILIQDYHFTIPPTQA